VSTTAASSTGALGKLARSLDGGGGGGSALKPISLDNGPTIDWTQQGGGEAAKKKKATEADAGDSKSSWRTDFVNALGATDGDRNPNARIRVTGVSDKDLGKPLYTLPKVPRK